MDQANKPEIMANRIRRLPEYLFAGINALKARTRASGVDVIDLGMGNPDQPAPAFITDKLCEVARDSKAHRYSISRGLLHLRREMARRYKERYDVDLDPETEVVVTIGSKEGLTHLMFAIIDEGDTVVVPSPTYPIHTFGVLMAGGVVLTLPLGDPRNLVSRLEATVAPLSPKPKVLILSFPHNPTSVTVEPGFFNDVVTFAKAHGLIVLHDLAYADLVFEGYQAPSFLQAPGAKDVGVEFFSMTKSYNMAGWRVGFMVGNKDVVGALIKIKSYLDYGIFTPIQVAAITALRSGEGPCKEIAEVYRIRRDILVDGLRKMGWEMENPRATMYVWARIPEKFRAMGSLKFGEKMLVEAGVSASPGVGFGAEGEGYMRFATVENDERIRQALRNMKRVFQPAGD